MQPPHIRVPQRQVAVRAQSVTVHQRGLRAVHRLQAEELLFDLDHEHVVPVVIPVARLLPEPLADEDRRRDLLVPTGVEVLTHEPLELAHHGPAVRQPEGRAGRDVVKREQIELAPELAVVALLRLLEPPEVLVELLLREPRRAVDPLEHRLLLVAAPVGARRRQQLERLELAGGLHVRPAAEVDEVALRVERHRRRGDALEDLDLVTLAAPSEELDRLRARHLLALERQVGFHDLAHDLLDLGEVLRREWRRAVEVVVEAVLDGGADGDFHLGKQSLHGLGHDVRGGVTEGRERRRVAVELAGQPEMTIFLSGGHTLLKSR